MTLTPAEADAIDVNLARYANAVRGPRLVPFLAASLLQVLIEHVGPDEAVLDLGWTIVEGAHISVPRQLTACIPTTRQILIAYVDQGVEATLTPVPYGTPVEHHWKPTRPWLEREVDGSKLVLGPGHADLTNWVEHPPARAAWLPAPPAPGKWPPSWYPDPGRRHDLRWWDGSQWWARVIDHGREHRKLISE